MKRWFLVIVVALTGCRTHTLADGTYSFTAGEVVRDDCGLQQHPELFTTGVLHTTGNLVRLDYALFDLRLTGNYLASEEVMAIEGLATNERLGVNGNDCLLTQFAARLDATAVDPMNLTGSWAFELKSDTPACVCKLWVKTAAVMTQAAP